MLLKTVWRLRKEYVDQGRRPLEFQVREKVMLKLSLQVWKRITAKKGNKGMIKQYEGVFEVLKKVGDVTCRLVLLDRDNSSPHISCELSEALLQ